MTPETLNATGGRRPGVESWYRELQERFCEALQALDGKGRFRVEPWDRPGGGGGDTRQLVDGSIFERASVNFSAVWGETPRMMSERIAAESPTFYATGISIIVHPLNPHAPTFHANLRFFSAGSEWFGGGADLTPAYFYEEDARHFHTVIRRVCDRHDVGDYASWKEDCDRYFYLPHRKEARGIGGIFFDHLPGTADVWAFQQDLGETLEEAYLPLIHRRAAEPYGEREKRWQSLRRGRYVEFNLVWDRGTRFGLETGGRTESILGSLPPLARWEEPWSLEPGSHEEATVSLLAGEPREWAD